MCAKLLGEWLPGRHESVKRGFRIGLHCKLAFYTHRNLLQMERLFMLSTLAIRPKVQGRRITSCAPWRRHVRDKWRSTNPVEKQGHPNPPEGQFLERPGAWSNSRTRIRHCGLPKSCHRALCVSSCIGTCRTRTANQQSPNVKHESQHADWPVCGDGYS